MSIEFHLKYDFKSFLYFPLCSLSTWRIPIRWCCHLFGRHVAIDLWAPLVNSDMAPCSLFALPDFNGFPTGRQVAIEKPFDFPMAHWRLVGFLAFPVTLNTWRHPMLCVWAFKILSIFADITPRTPQTGGPTQGTWLLVCNIILFENF